MQNIIRENLSELEKIHGIRILFACESGSRAWGFPSTDSDYDVRFIYVHQKQWYLSVHEKRDVIEVPVNRELDINGWDLRKALRLLSKKNAVIFEWTQSPIVYKADTKFIEGLNAISPSYFSPIAVLHHYLSSAKKHYEECDKRDRIKLKKYFYCLRSILSALWIVSYKTIPPMELMKLLRIIEGNQQLICKIQELIELKATKDESYCHPRDAELEDFFKEGILLCEKAAKALPSSSPDGKRLDIFLKNMIEG